jgi:hypothetical protein
MIQGGVMNLLDMVKGQLTDEVLGKLGGAVNLPVGDVSKAMGAIVPVQLNALIQQGSTSQGAQNLMGMLGNVGNLGNFASVLGGAGGLQNIIKMGESLLPGLFGNQLSGIIGGIAKATGIGQGPLGGLMGMAAPLVMGQLGNVVKTQGLNPAGLMSMLGSLQGPVSGLLPAGLGDLMKGLGGVAGTLGAAGAAVQGLGGAASSAASSLGGAASSLGGAAGTAAQQVARRGGIPWLIPALAVAGIGLVAWWFLGRGGAPNTATTPPATMTDTSSTTGSTDSSGAGVADACAGKTFSLSVTDGASVTEGFRFGGEGSGKGYAVTISRVSDGRQIGVKQLPLGADCTYGYDSRPGKGQIKYEVRPMDAAADSTPVSTVTLTVQ